MASVTIVVIDGRPGIYTWADGYKFRREESLLEQARKGEDHLLQACLWLENHGRSEDTWELLERFLN